MRGSDRAPDRAVRPMKRALARLRHGGLLCAGPAQRPIWVHILGAAFLVAIAVGLPAPVAASSAGSMVSDSSSCHDQIFSLTATPGNGQVALSWTVAPGATRDLTSYTVE